MVPFNRKRLKRDSTPKGRAAKSVSSISGPSVEIKNRFIEKILNSHALGEEIKKLEIAVEHISYLLALYEFRMDFHLSARKERLAIKEKIDDGLKKIKKHHPIENESNRAQLLKSYTLPATRKIILENSSVGKFDSRHNPLLGELFVNLKSYLETKTTRPLRILAGISILFNLRPGKKCPADCKWNKTTCTIKNVLLAPCHSNERHALSQMIGRAEKRLYRP